MVAGGGEYISHRIYRSYFYPSAGQCALPATITIVVSNSIMPTFSQLGPYCVNSTPGNLSAISSNGIAGTWSPSTINTTVPGSYVHTFTPNPGQCGTPATMTVVITNPVTPTFLPLGPYCQNDRPLFHYQCCPPIHCL